MKACHLISVATEVALRRGQSLTEEFSYFELFGILLFLSSSHPTTPSFYDLLDSGATL